VGPLSTIARYRRCSEGATAIEYALIAGLIAVVLVPGLLWLRDWQHRISDKLDAATGLTQVRDDNREPVHESKAEVRDDNRAPVQAD
jgi:Flp pilus assembly pilin Flp